MLAHLKARYGEVPVSYGPSNAGGLVELLESGPDDPNPTWSIIVTAPNGVSCLIAAGEGWRTRKPVDPET